MNALLRLFFAVLMGALFITGIFYVVASILSSIAFNPESRAWKELLAKLRIRLNKRAQFPATGVSGSLVPCNAETLSHLSLKPKIVKKAGWRDGTFEGMFTTIYQEPVLLYAGQRNGKMAAIVARTSDKEFVFRQKGKETEIWENGQPYAVFVNNTLLSTGKQSRMLAKLEMDSDLRQWPVLMGQSDAALLTNMARVVSPIPRAFTILRGLSPEEEQALLLLTVAQELG